MTSFNRVLNIVHGYLIEGLDEDSVRDFDRQLGADPNLVARVGLPSKGSDMLMKLMGGKKPPPAPVGGQS